VLVFACRDDYTAERINTMFDLAQSERGGAVSEAAGHYRKMLLANYPARGPGVDFQHAARRPTSAWALAPRCRRVEEIDSPWKVLTRGGGRDPRSAGPRSARWRSWHWLPRRGGRWLAKLEEDCCAGHHKLVTGRLERWALPGRIDASRCPAGLRGDL